MIRTAIESMYKGQCTIYEYHSIKNPTTKVNQKTLVKVLDKQPCRVSIKNITSAQNGFVASISQAITLFISPDIVINPGSKISVEQNGTITDYQRSGKPAKYSNHQEVALEIFEELI